MHRITGGDSERSRMTIRPIVIIGSVNMDLVVRCARLPRPGETVLGYDFRTLPGGKGANQAVAAARLGAAVEFVGCVGDDAFGAQSVAALRGEGIGVDHLGRVAGAATGVALIQVSDAGENSIAVAPGANHVLSVRHIDAAAARIATAAMLVCQLESPLDVVRRAIEVARAAGVPVLLNPAPAQPLPDTLLGMVSLLVPNEGEAAALAAITAVERATAVDAALALRGRGASTVLVTLGADGVLLADQGGCLRLPAYPARAVDTTGAGDAFVGALAAACAAGDDLHSAIDFAQRAAACSVERHGAQAAMARRDQLPPRRAAQTGTA
jgi:ribokinase